MELDNKLLDRIKDDISKENGYSKWYTNVSYEHLWPEVCRRYAEEVSINDSMVFTKELEKKENEIHKLKKQLKELQERYTIAEYALRDIDCYSDVADPPLKAKDLGDIATNALNKLLVIEKSKLEVKEKPDLLALFKKYARMNWEWEWVEDYGALNFSEFKKALESVIVPGDIAIAERDAKISEFESKLKNA